MLKLVLRLKDTVIEEYNLEKRTLQFTREVISYVNGLPKTQGNIEIGKQVIRSAGSIGANYIEANEALGKKDFAMRIRICRKEAKESRYWLKLIDTDGPSEIEMERASLENEARELTHIFGSIVTKCE